MPQLSCPSCGADVPLRSAAMPYAVCGYCQTLILRKDGTPEAIGTSAVLPFDISPVQLGTTGQADGQPFTIVGRVRWGWTDGSWNEWLLQCGDGSVRWLAEAMGTFMLTAERPDVMASKAAATFAAGGAIEIGDVIAVDGEQFTAADIKDAQCLGGEGDLPFPTPPDWTITSVDFRSPSGAALSIQRSREDTQAWLGRYVSLAELKPANLRAIDGWAVPEFLT